MLQCVHGLCAKENELWRKCCDLLCLIETVWNLILGHSLVFSTCNKKPKCMLSLTEQSFLLCCFQSVSFSLFLSVRRRNWWGPEARACRAVRGTHLWQGMEVSFPTYSALAVQTNQRDQEGWRTCELFPRWCMHCLRMCSDPLPRRQVTKPHSWPGFIDLRKLDLSVFDVHRHQIYRHFPINFTDKKNWYLVAIYSKRYLVVGV